MFETRGLVKLDPEVDPDLIHAVRLVGPLSSYAGINVGPEGHVCVRAVAEPQTRNMVKAAFESALLVGSDVKQWLTGVMGRPALRGNPEAAAWVFSRLVRDPQRDLKHAISTVEEEMEKRTKVVVWMAGRAGLEEGQCRETID